MAMEDYLDMDYDHGGAIFGWIDCEKFVHELKQKPSGFMFYWK